MSDKTAPRPVLTARPFPSLFLPALFTGLAGAIAFEFAQRLEGLTPTIPVYMGRAIVRRGGYPEGLETVIGWGVHVSVSVAYAAIFAIAAWTLFGAMERRLRWIGSGILAAILGVATTLITAPAIAATISILSGDGLPDSLPPLNMGWGWPAWNHLVFFGIAWLGTVVVLDRD
ncbi:MAG: hypothetical protein E4H28_03135 [Gemmatimonadales bacterium]|nr:MAG: hypothetical protein E4H28_03135 [Gemmatimonadales bacterium]